MNMHVEVGPHGLKEIDALQTSDVRAKGALRVQAYKTDKMRLVLLISDAAYRRLMDAYWDPEEGERKAAEQWLLDWCTVLYGGGG